MLGPRRACVGAHPDGELTAGEHELPVVGSDRDCADDAEPAPRSGELVDEPPTAGGVARSVDAVLRWSSSVAPRTGEDRVRICRGDKEVVHRGCEKRAGNVRGATRRLRALGMGPRLSSVVRTPHRRVSAEVQAVAVHRYRDAQRLAGDRLVLLREAERHVGALGADVNDGDHASASSDAPRACQLDAPEAI